MTEPPTVPAPPPGDQPLPGESPAPRSPGNVRFRAALEVLICSGVPSQLLIAQTLALGGLMPFDGERLNGTWVFAMALGDTLLMTLLVPALLLAGGERPRDVLFGHRRPAREAGLGLVLVIPLVLLAGLTMAGLRELAPWLHNVPVNPLSELMTTPADAAMFGTVAIMAGGVREELQRAFLLHRFEQHLGGARVGLWVTSAAFGLGHALQGWDAAIATGLLGFAWALVYLRRRSVVAPMVSHGGFNSMEILRWMLLPAELRG